MDEKCPRGQCPRSGCDCGYLLPEELEGMAIDERFEQLPPLEFGEIRAYVAPNAGIVAIKDKFFKEQTVCLYVAEARALRDWLTKVLPAQGKEGSRS